jgi:glycosyltransferase involved in cell wall biosynthesis
LRLLFISNFYPPNRTAGTEIRTLGYAEALQARGHDVQVICVDEWNKGNRYWNAEYDQIVNNVPVHRIHLNWMRAPDPNRFLYCNPATGKLIRQWLSEHKIDLVHVTSCLTMSASVIQAARESNVPVVLTLTDFWFICPKINLLRYDGSMCDGRVTGRDCLHCMLSESKAYRALHHALPESVLQPLMQRLTKNRFLSRLRGFRGRALDMEHRKSFLAKAIHAVDFVTTPSANSRDMFLGCGVTRPIRVIYSGHDLSWLKNNAEKTSSDLVRFGYIGQVAAIKGVHLLVSAFASSSLAGRARLIIYGNHSQNPEYQRRLEEMQSRMREAVEFRGGFSHDRLGDIFSEIDVLVVPSLWQENNPRVIQESFAAKTPVIASNVRGISEFVQHEVNGLLFERANVQDLQRQLERVVGTQHLLADLRNGISPVKTIAEEVLEMEAVYRELLRDRHDTGTRRAPEV